MIERRKTDIIFTIALSVFLITGILAMSLAGVDGLAFKLLRYLSYVLLAFKIVSMAYERRNVTLGILTGAIMILSYVNCRDVMLIIYLLIILAAFDVDTDYVLRLYLIIQSILLTAIVSLALLGIIEDYVSTDIISESLRVRHFLGFIYTTNAPILFLFIVLEYIYLRRGRLRLIEYITGMLITIMLKSLTDTTYAFMVTAGILTFFYFGQLLIERGQLPQTFRRLICISPFIFAVLAILAQYMYDAENGTWTAINELVHGRLQIGYDGIYNYGFSLLGQNIAWVGNSYENISPQGYNYVDCSYLQIGLWYGIIPLVLILTGYSYILYRLIRNRIYYGVWLILAVLVFSITEPRLFNLIFNPFIILVFTGLERRGEYITG